MNRIIIIVKLIIAIIPAFIIGYLLRLSFKHIPDWLFYAIVLIIAVVGGLYLIFITRKKYIEDGAEEYMPKWLDKSSYLYVIIGSIIGVLLASTTFRTILYVDNGRSVPVSVNILYDQTFIIPAKSYPKLVQLFKEVQQDEAEKLILVSQ